MRVVNIATILAALSCLGPICCGAYQDSTLSTILGANTKYSEQRCDSSSDCNGEDKICHENRCICSKEKPIEDQDRCLPQALIGEQCSIESQCLVDSLCIDGICACGIDAVSIYNPSSRLFYCQPKRGLNEECNSDLQCPLNAYCSGSRGCLCSNGFSPANVSNAGVETTECLPKTCSSTSDCEEYHQCDENRCKCLPLHFDVSRAKCYKYGAKLLSGDQANQEGDSKNSAPTNHLADDFISILKDLTSRTSDNLWLVLIILIALSLLLLILILSLLRKHYLGYCWTAHKKEYEPNTAKQQAPRNGHFDKNSINNKSFRRRNGEMDDDAENDSSTEDKSNLVAKKTTIFNNNNTSSSSRNQGDFVTVNLNGKEEDNESPASEHRRLHQGPLKSSTSTPV